MERLELTLHTLATRREDHFPPEPINVSCGTTACRVLAGESVPSSLPSPVPLRRVTGALLRIWNGKTSPGEEKPVTVAAARTSCCPPAVFPALQPRTAPSAAFSWSVHGSSSGPPTFQRRSLRSGQQHDWQLGKVTCRKGTWTHSLMGVSLLRRTLPAHLSASTNAQRAAATPPADATRGVILRCGGHSLQAVPGSVQGHSTTFAAVIACPGELRRPRRDPSRRPAPRRGPYRVWNRQGLDLDPSFRVRSITKRRLVVRCIQPRCTQRSTSSPLKLTKGYLWRRIVIIPPGGSQWRPCSRALPSRRAAWHSLAAARPSPSPGPGGSRGSSASARGGPAQRRLWGVQPGRDAEGENGPAGVHGRYERVASRCNPCVPRDGIASASRAFLVIATDGRLSIPHPPVARWNGSGGRAVGVSLPKGSQVGRI